MSYISPSGLTSGPLNIDRTWICTVTGEDNNLYLATKQSRYTNNYRPMLAGTPNTGYNSSTGEFYAPDNAVVTIGWFKSVYALDLSGIKDFYPDNYVTKMSFNALSNSVTSLNSMCIELQNKVDSNNAIVIDHSGSISSLIDNQTEHTARILKIHNWIVGNNLGNYDEDYPTKFTIKCGNASSFVD